MKKITRLYTGPDGESHFDEIELPTDEETDPIYHSKPMKAKDLFITERPHTDDEWHNAPCRQLYVILEGWLELEVGDGTTRRFHPGDIFLAEDTTGRGHLSRINNRRAIMIRLE